MAAREEQAKAESEAEEPAAAEPEPDAAESEEPAAAEPEPVVAESEEPAATEPEPVVAESEEPAAAEPEPVVAESEAPPEADDSASEDKSPISKEEGELLALQELGNLQQLANEHEDTTQQEIKALESALAKGDSRKKLDRLREAGRRLSDKVKLEFKALLKREEKLLSNIEESRHKIEEVEKEPESEKPPKVVKELKVLEGLADDYKATTADEIKALEALAKAIK